MNHLLHLIRKPASLILLSIPLFNSVCATGNTDEPNPTSTTSTEFSTTSLPTTHLPTPTTTFSTTSSLPAPSTTPISPTVSTTPVAAPDFLYPSSRNLFSSSSQFSLQELMDDDQYAASGACLTVDPTRTTSSAGATSKASGVILGLTLSSVFFVTQNYPLGVLSLLGTLGTVMAEEEKRQLNNLVPIPLSEAQTYAISSTLADCDNIQSSQRFRFESIYSLWGDYGWITVDGFPTINGYPRCLTKNPNTQTLTVENCSYIESNGVRKVYDRQMWKFDHNRFIREPNEPVFRSLKNRADEAFQCIRNDDGGCRDFWFGELITSPDGCRQFPGGVEPSTCPLDKRSSESKDNSPE